MRWGGAGVEDATWSETNSLRVSTFVVKSSITLRAASRSPDNLPLNWQNLQTGLFLSEKMVGPKEPEQVSQVIWGAIVDNL